MIVKLEKSNFAAVRPLFEAMQVHLPVEAILAGDIPGDIYADDPARPGFALTWTGHRFYLAGAPPEEAGLEEIRRIFLEVFRPEALALGKELFYIHYPSGNQQDLWESAVQAILEGRDPVRFWHQVYAWDARASKGLRGDWRSMLPEGVELRLVDASLLAEGQIKNPEYLTEEMLSERPSLEEYLAKSFGVCLVHQDEIVGWCLSEYNTGSRCEVGIATREDFRRRGLATLMTLAFMELALSRGVTQIGWHCSAENIPSGATALKAGFEKAADYPISLGWFDPAINLAQNGYIALFGERWAVSLRFFERSFALGDLPGWAYWGGACAAARVGRSDQAFGYLEEAIARGFRDVERLRASEHLVGLHEHPGWAALLERLAVV